MLFPVTKKIIGWREYLCPKLKVWFIINTFPSFQKIWWIISLNANKYDFETQYSNILSYGMPLIYQLALAVETLGLDFFFLKKKLHQSMNAINRDLERLLDSSIEISIIVAYRKHLQFRLSVVGIGSNSS